LFLNELYVTVQSPINYMCFVHPKHPLVTALDVPLAHSLCSLEDVEVVNDPFKVPLITDILL